jgi:predicted permease
MFARVRSLWRGIVGRSAMEDDMADELRFHIEARTADLIASGLAPDDARRRAQIEFGPTEAFKDECRQARGLGLLDDLRADLRYALRTLARTPAFALMAIVSLALGIGANTVVFSVVNALVLRPLPVEDPARVFFVQPAGGGHSSTSFPNYRDLRDASVSFEGLVGYRISPINIETGSTPIRTWGYLATGNYFDVLGVKPALGRFFHQQDDLREGDAPFAVISYDCWTGRFGADPSIVGRTVRLNRTPFTIVGVAPRGFRGTELFFRPDIWVPMMMEPQIEVGNPWLDNRHTGNTWMFGRLKPGVTVGAAEGDLNAVAARLAHDFPDVNEGMRLKLSRPGLVGDLLGGPVRAFTFGVLVLAGLVLLAACANLASVLAARGADRQRELAVRMSIGASRGRIVRQLLTETLLLACAGGAAGCALAFVAARALTAWHAPIDVPIQFDIPVDVRVLLFASITSIAAGLLFGVAPARQAAATDPNRALKETDGAQAAGHRWPVRDVLVAVQVALCVVLVSACALSLRGLQQALTMSLGMDPRGVTMVGFDLGLAGYSKEAGAQFQRRALDAVSRLPGVESAAYSNSLPLSIDQSTNVLHPDDRQAMKASDMFSAHVYEVSPGFLRTLGIRRELGRDIEWRDTAGVPRVAIVNRAFARTVMRTGNPIGRHFEWGWRTNEPTEIIAVVEDGKYESLTERATPAVFEPIMQRYNATTVILVKSSLPSEQIVAALRQAIASLDPSLPLYESGTVQQMLGFAMFPSQAAAVALSAFGILAMVLAATGIHGLVAYAVSRRRREIGIRIAIGASAGNVLRVVLGRIALLLGIGAAAGLLLAVAAGQLLSTIVYQASPRDPLTLAIVAAIIVAVGATAAWMPARRSLTTHPMDALRPE